jgi:predicted DNA binding CopG/RHH family protein
VDFSLTSILLPNGFSGLDGRALALWKTGNLELPVFSGRQPCRSISHRLQTRRRYLQTDDSGKTRGAESDMRRKEARVEVRMTEHEKEALKRKAAKNGMTVSEYARTLLANSDDATIRVIDTEPLRKAAHELAKQGTNLNQFMKFLNTYGIKVFDAGEAQRVLAREVETFMEVAEALAALRREADRNNVHLKIEDFDSAEND